MMMSFTFRGKGKGDPYRKLASNTLIFGVSTFSSKALVFLMIPIYTRVLSGSEYGMLDLIVNVCNLLMPIVSAGIAGAVIRFGLERHVNKKAVFSVGIMVSATGALLMPFLMPVLLAFDFAAGYAGYIYIYVITACLRAVCGQFTRVMGYVRLYAADSLLRTAFTIGFNILLLIVFPLGIKGYLLANILSDFLSALILIVHARLYLYFDLREINGKILRGMLRYAVPLIPATIFVWIINISSRYMIAYFLGNEANGLYAVAYKIPTLIVIVSAIFMDAWQISAMDAASQKTKGHIFSNVLNVYQSLVFLTGSSVIFFSKTIIRILAVSSYYVAWRYIPVLTMATAVMCLSSFFGSIYMVEKKSVSALMTTMVGAAINIVLNLMLIPRLGVQGAAVSLLVSYMVILMIRARHTRRFVRIRGNLPKLLLNLFLMGLQCLIMLTEPTDWMTYQTGLLLLMTGVNAPALLTGIKKMI